MAGFRSSESVRARDRVSFRVVLEAFEVVTGEVGGAVISLANVDGTREEDDCEVADVLSADVTEGSPVSAPLVPPVPLATLLVGATLLEVLAFPVEVVIPAEELLAGLPEIAVELLPLIVVEAALVELADESSTGSLLP